MLSQRVSNFIKSYVVVNLNTKNYEKVLNLLRRKNIIMWDVNKVQDGISFKIYKKDFEKNKQFFQDANIKPIKKIGVKFKLNKLYMRVGFVIGAIIIFIYAFVFCTFAWDIKVIGNEKLKENDIVEYLNENHIKTPIKIKKINNKYIEDLIYSKFSDIKFIEAHVEGINLVLFVKEKKETEYAISDNTPTSIVSNKQAVIYKTVVKHGELLVKEGDVVSVGQLLVQGTKKDKDNTSKLINSDATIFGYTYYNLTLNEPKTHVIKKETGKTNNIFRLIIKDKKIKIFGNENKYENYDSKSKIISIPLITDFLNISFEKVKQYELEVKEQETTREYAENKLLINLHEKLVKICNKNAKIDKKDIVLEETDTEYILRAKIQMIEDIGEIIKIYSLKEEG